MAIVVTKWRLYQHIVPVAIERHDVHTIAASVSELAAYDNL